MNLGVLNSLALCGNRSFSHARRHFAAQARRFVRFSVRVVSSMGLAFQGVSF